MMEALIISNILSWIAVVALMLVTYALLRQVGLLHERMGPVGALTTASGVKPGEASPRFMLPSLTGGSHTIGEPSVTGRSTLLFFVSPDCPICKELLPVIRAVRAREARWLDVVLASDGEREAQKAYILRQGLDDFPYLLSAELGLAFGVNKLPYAVLLDENAIVVTHGLTNTREHIESLFEAKHRGVASIQDYLEKEQGAA